MITTRTHLPASGEFDRDTLDAIGDHTHQFEESDFEEIRDELSDLFGNGIAGVNYFRNAGLDLWTRGSSALSLSEGNRQERADFWWARADYAAIGSGGGGTFATYERVADAVHQNRLYAVKLTGTTGVAGIDFGQELPARIACGLHPKCTLSLEIQNNTGATITPTVRLDTCDTFENYGAVTNQIAQSIGTAILNGARTAVTVTLDLTAIGTQLRNGALLYLRFIGMGGVGNFVTVYAAKLEIGESATDNVVERVLDAPPAGATAAASQERNFLSNGNLAEWLDASVTCPEDVDSFGPLDWYANPDDGSTMVLAQSTLTPSVSSRFSAELTGEAAVNGTVDFGQIMVPKVATEARRQLVFSCYVYNETGGSFVPNFRVDTCDTELSTGDVHNQVDQVLAPCANASWTLVSHTFDAASLSLFFNGARIYLRLPAGTLDDPSKKVRFAQARLEIGTTATAFLPVPPLNFPAVIAPLVRNLRISRATTSTGTITFDEIILKSAAGDSVRIGASSLALNTATTGLGGIDTGAIAGNTHYYFWAVAKSDTVVQGLISLSATAPTLPEGYIHRGLIGSIRTDGSGFPQFYTVGNITYFAEAATPAFNGTVTLADTFQALSLANYVPPIAREAIGTAGVNSANDCHIMVAGSSLGIGGVTISGKDAGAAAYGFRASGMFRVPLVVPQEVQIKASVNTPTYRVIITGFVLPINAS